MPSPIFGNVRFVTVGEIACQRQGLIDLLASKAWVVTAHLPPVRPFFRAIASESLAAKAPKKSATGILAGR
ncbi:MAG: hypothetical protein LBU43_02505 [Candidatus Accumulibacter sp.]|jgi:hypothetical protein|nr:hypothetical protein [Accumulibacter sp.]